MYYKCYAGPVFSAHAEVVPLSLTPLVAWMCILRARGGSSIILLIDRPDAKYSPRTRR